MRPKKSDVANIEKNKSLLKNAPSYRFAIEDPDFLEGNAGREIRLLSEFLKTERALLHENVVSTVVVFGSARILPPEIAQTRYDEAKTLAEDSPNDPALARNLKVAENALEFSKYYQIARELGELLATKNARFNEEIGARGEIKVNKEQEYVVCTGGGPGIMEAANRGAYDASHPTIGLNISLPFEQEPNPYISPELCFNFRYFAMRKMHFLLRAKALVAFPGGFGTFDELFEALTLRQTGKMQDLPIVLFGEEFWKKAVNFQYLVDSGVISPQDLNLFKFAKTAEEAWNIIDEYHQGKK